MSRRASHIKSPNDTDKSDIPSFLSDPPLSHTQRYVVADGASDVVSLTMELPILPYGISQSTTKLAVPFKSVRLARVRMWCVYRPSVAMSGNTINLSIVERPGARPIEWSATASYKNAVIDKSFNPDEPLGWYYPFGTGVTNPELTFQMPKGAVLDLTFVYILDDTDAMNTLTGAGFTAERLYTNQLSINHSAVGRAYQTPIVL